MDAASVRVESPSQLDASSLRFRMDAIQTVVKYRLSCVLFVSDIKEYIKYIEKAVSTREARFMSRALRALVTLRKKLNQNVLRTAIQGYFPNVSIPKDGMLDFLEEVRFLAVFPKEKNPSKTKLS